MKNVTLSEKNFKRFAKRYQQLHNISLTQAQENLAKIFGANNYYELIKNFSNDEIKNKYDGFYKEIKNIFYSSQNIKMAYFILNENNDLILFFENTNPLKDSYLEISDKYIKKTLLKLKSCQIDFNLYTLFTKYLPKNNIDIWAKGLFEYLKEQDNFIPNKKMSILSLNIFSYAINNGALIDFLEEKRKKDFEQDILNDYMRMISSLGDNEEDTTGYEDFIKMDEVLKKSEYFQDILEENTIDIELEEHKELESERFGYKMWIAEEQMFDSAFSYENIDEGNYQDLNDIEDINNEYED